MTHDVRQWLGEIKHLQQKLAEAQKERDEAFASAANWRSLYETEAKQRRAEANLARQTVESLTSELQQLRQPAAETPISAEAIAQIKQQVSSLDCIETLREQLLQVLIECDRLTQTLRAEQHNHIQTRQELTLALGDTMDVLAREHRTHKGCSQGVESDRTGRTNNNGEAAATPTLPSVKTPSLERPIIDPVQSRI